MDFLRLIVGDFQLLLDLRLQVGDMALLLQRDFLEPLDLALVEDFGEGKRVCVRWIFHGTHKGPFAGVEPKGAKVKLSGVVVAKVRKGKIAEMHSVFDTAELQAMMTSPAKVAPKKK